MEKGEPIVVVKEISKSYGKVEALKEVSFAVEQGEIFGLIGPDGAGKSTLFRILTTLLLADKGTATVNRLDVVTDYKQIRTKVGYMPGRFSLYQDLSVEENLELFTKMKNGEFKDGEKVLRAKIDMSSPNINMRDPILYRVAHIMHHNTGDKWCIYPMYDFAHPIEDAIEGITHSICTLEFEDHRPLYNWVVTELEYPHPPKQIEFAKLYLTNVVTGKRYIKKLVEQGIVD